MTQISILPDPSAGLVDNFGTGLTVNYAATYFTPPPELAAQAQSQWSIAQWGQATAITPNSYIQNSPTTFDPVYGNAQYAWSAPGTTTAIAIYQNTTALGGGSVYDLTSGNTILPPSSGSTEEADEFLSSPSTAGNANLSHPITLSLNAKIAQSDIQFATPQLAAQYATSGAVFGTLDIGITVNFNGAGGLPAFSGFVQIVPWTSDSTALANYTSGAVSTTDPSAQFCSSTLAKGDPTLGLLSADAGANPDTLTYNVNNYVYKELQVAYANFTPAQQAVLLNMANWTLGGIYIGPATNDAETTDANGVSSLVAQVTTGIQVSNFSLTSNTSATYNPSKPVASVAKVDNNPQIKFHDNTLNASGSVDGAVYSGSLAGIQDEYIYTGDDNVTLTATAGANWVFGGGTAASTLTATSGNNVFIASTGGSTMNGGSGNDIFEVQDANLSGVGVTDVLTGFHAGDTLSLAGLAGPGWSYAWSNGSVTGGGGVTLTATSTATPGLQEIISFAGSGLSLKNISLLSVSPDPSGNGALIITRPASSGANVPKQQTAKTTAVAHSSINSAVGINTENLYSGQNAMQFLAPAGDQVSVASAAGSVLSGLNTGDAFVIPMPTAGSVTDHISNFHSGDAVLLTGIDKAGWTYGWSPAPHGQSGLTLNVQSNTQAGVSEHIMFTGLSASHLSAMVISNGTGANAGTLIVTM